MGKRQVIWTYERLFDDDAREAYGESKRGRSGDAGRGVTDEEWADEVYMGLEEERANLDMEVDGVIIALMDIGTWNVRRPGCRIVGGNVAEILRSPHDAEWYGDTYNIRCVEHHHDGVNHVLYRVAGDMESAERVAGKILDGTVDESRFREMTRSLYPYVAGIYGWKTGRWRRWRRPVPAAALARVADPRGLLN